MSLTPAIVIAGNRTIYTVSVLKTEKEPGNGEPMDWEGRRIPSMPLCCTIDKVDGLNIMGVSEDIISYEILDIETETTLILFLEESEFLDFIFHQTGDFKMKIETENYYFWGYITIS